MSKLDERAILKEAQKHKKWMENCTVNAFAYRINQHSYYLAFYGKKWSNAVTGNAIISLDSSDRKEALKALSPMVHFSISSNNIRNSAGEIAKKDFSIHREIRHYLQSILKAGVLSQENEQIYERSYQIIDSMISLQQEMVELWQEAKDMYDNVIKKGFFTEEEMERSLNYVPIINMIQYNQFKPRYDHCKDFDVIYQNRNDPKIKPYEKFSGINTLKGMTSGAAEQQLKDAVDRVTAKGQESHMSDSEIKKLALKYYRDKLSKRVDDFKKILRYP